MTTATSIEQTDETARAIVHAWMAHLGYTPEQIAEGEAARDHSACGKTPEGWQCEDEYGVPRHHVHDEMDDVAALVMFVREYQESPRVWAMPEIQDDVEAVTDRDGNLWISAFDNTHWTSGGGIIRPTRRLIADHGPLTEVVTDHD